MDKKNIIIGSLLLIAAFVVFIYGPKNAPPPSTPQVVRSPVPGANEAPGPASSTLPAVSPSNTTFAALATKTNDERVTVLSNDFIEARFTDFGGAIDEIAFKRFPAVLGGTDPFIFNEQHADPMLAFTRDTFPGLDRTVRYELVSHTEREIVFRAVFENRIEVTRRYIISPSDVPSGEGDPYRIRHEITFRNLTDQTVALPRFALNLGTVAPVNARDNGLFLATGLLNAKGDTTFIDRNKLAGGNGFLGMGARPPVPYIDSNESIVWASVSNQFFTGILTPDQPGRGLLSRRIELPPVLGTSTVAVGMTAAASFEVDTLAPGASTTIGMQYYAGPKEYTRLARFSQSEHRVMQFDRYFFNRVAFSAVIAPAMNTLMNFMHRFVGNWGVAIILMTLLLKVVSLPFTLAASRAAKRMQKIQPEMKEIQEKFKDNPQKKNQATMELFKKHKVNPMGGCLPVLITIPLFIAFFVMLQSAAELRFQSFLWTQDLSAPDTVAILWGFPLNIMPLLMGATMYYQMRMTPSPSVDNAQMKMMKFMPVIFTIFCYNFAGALALYSTVNGLFTIGQQFVVNRMKEPVTVAVQGAPAGGRGLKNVTPDRKKGSK